MHMHIHIEDLYKKEWTPLMTSYELGFEFSGPVSRVTLSYSG